MISKYEQTTSVFLVFNPSKQPHETGKYWKHFNSENPSSPYLLIDYIMWLSCKTYTSLYEHVRKLHDFPGKNVLSIFVQANACKALNATRKSEQREFLQHIFIQPKPDADCGYK